MQRWQSSDRPQRRYAAKVNKTLPKAKKAPKRQRAEARYLYFTAAALAKLKPEPGKQYLVWDAWDHGRKNGPDAARGLCVLVSPSGTKSFRASFYFRGNPKPHYVHLGRVGELVDYVEGETDTEHLTREIEEARMRTRAARALANPSGETSHVEPKDPREGITGRRGGDTIEEAIRTYIKEEQIGRLGNTSAGDTQTIMLDRCGPWLNLRIASISYRDVEKLLAGVRDGADGRKPSPSMAVRLYSHLKVFFKWAGRPGGPAKVSPVRDMPPPATIEERDRVYSADELRAIWLAADKVDAVMGAYVKATMLLATRKNEMAKAQWSEFDNADEPSLIVIPSARVKLKAETKKKKKPVYFVPLPPLAQRIIKRMRGRDAVRVFAGLDLKRLKAALVKHGAPKDFMLHTFRHTITTWLEKRGRSLWERALVLNHSSGGVTEGYSHGYPLDLKRQMLTEWADYVEGLVGGEGVAVMR